MHDPYLYHHPELRFTDCRVPDANRVPSGGNEGAKRWFVIERLMIAARCCGASQRLVDEATAWAKEREAFGAPIAEYQAVQFMLADSLTELLAARLLTYHAAEAFDSEPDEKIVHGKVAMAKLYASEAAGRIADRVVQIFGGRGYMTEYAAERHYRELRVDRIWEGTSEIQRLIIARGLIKRGRQAYDS
jgi:alkylation response protein AidB-like acyl-CoA dehydrogenase